MPVFVLISLFEFKTWHNYLGTPVSFFLLVPLYNRVSRTDSLDISLLEDVLDAGKRENLGHPVYTL